MSVLANINEIEKCWNKVQLQTMKFSGGWEQCGTRIGFARDAGNIKRVIGDAGNANV